MSDLDKTIKYLEEKISYLLNNLNELDKNNSNIPDHSYRQSKDNIQFETLANLIQEPVILLDSKGKISFCNDASGNLFDLYDDSIIGSELIDLFHKDNQNKSLKSAIDEFINTGKWSSKNNWVLKPKYTSKKDLVINLHGSSEVSLDLPRLLITLDFIKQENTDKEQIPLFENELQNEFAHLERTTEELVETNTKLKERSIKLEKENQNKDKFFEILSHDLRSPFNAILGLTQILEEDSEELTPEEVKMMATKVNDLSRLVLSFIEELLDWARLQSGNLDFISQEFDIYDIIDDAVSLQQQNAHKKNIKFEYQITNLPKLNSDKNIVFLIMRNLLSNAVKFTYPNGTVKIDAEIVDGFMKISVCDNGMGIEEENIPKILDTSVTFTTPGTDQEKGTGLGTNLCVEFVKRLGGEMFIKSEINKGSEFTFTIPLEQDHR
ncbi:MAG: PAS domain-containing sensor histidine kinase [Melioribacteraceae bacterium]|nr:PAS domain-containing sensor histidine kinase [Melioribacteraceae bacterium]MDD3558314.1 PAS domain-containing sensor histidine kinase [Melioribacteraceae bacterium]